MKKSKILLAVIMGFVALTLVTSCSKDEYLKNHQNITLNETVKIKKLNVAQIDYLVKKGAICEACPRTNTCLWSDGSGSINCNGGTCSLSSVSSGSSTSVCLHCDRPGTANDINDFCKTAHIVVPDIISTIYDETIYSVD